MLDELVGGVKEAAWPLVRTDLDLSYVQIGTILCVPGVVGSVIEPMLGILADTWRRRSLMIGGGIVFGVSLAMTAASRSFLPLLLSFTLFSPASGAFVSISQVTLMASEPSRKEQNMARWTFAGSLGMTAGPLALAAAGPIGWRGLFLASAVIAFVLTVLVWRSPAVGLHPVDTERGGVSALLDGFRGALRALRRGEVLRWLCLLEFADLSLDVLFGFLALYFVDVVGVSAGAAASAVVLWTVAGLAGDFLVIPLIEKAPPLPYLRTSAAAMVVAFPVFLLVGPVPVKLVLLGFVGIAKAGWYSILKARLYHTLPGKPGTAMAVCNLAGLIGGLVPLGIGAVAQAAGLKAAMWLLAAGPIAILVGLPRKAKRDDV